MKTKLFKILLFIVLISLVISSSVMATSSIENLDNTSLVENSISDEDNSAENLTTNETTTLEETNGGNEEDSTDIIANYKTDYEYVLSDLFLFDENVESNQVVDGNVFIMGSDVTISGIIYGDLFVFSSSLTITDSCIVYGNIYSFATDITMAGATSDIYFMSNNFTLEETGYVARNMNVFSSVSTIKGNITRDVNLYTDTLSIADTAKIEGNLNYSSVNEFEINSDSVAGEINYTKLQDNTNSTSNTVWSIVYSSISTIIFAFALIMLLLWISPKFHEKAGKILAKKSLLSIGIGLLAFFGIIILFFILLLFTYGFAANVAVTLIGLLILAYAISQTIFSMGMGKLICNKFNLNKNTPYVLISLLVILVIKLLSYVPYFGGIISFATSITGLGMLFINAYKRKDLTNSSNGESKN